MEPITLNLPDLGQWAPYGWLAAYMLAVAFFGGISYRHIRLAGVSTGEVQNAHMATFIVSGILGLALFIAALCSANELFDRSIRLADKNLEVHERIALLEEREDAFVRSVQFPHFDWERDQDLVKEIKGGHCERLVAQFGKQAVETVALP